MATRNKERGREGGPQTPHLISSVRGGRKKRGGLKGRGNSAGRHEIDPARLEGICTASKPNRPNHNKYLRLRYYHSALVDVQLCVGMTKILCLTCTAAYGQPIIKVKQEQEKSCRSHGQRLLLSPCSHRFAKTLTLYCVTYVTTQCCMPNADCCSPYLPCLLSFGCKKRKGHQQPRHLLTVITPTEGEGEREWGRHCYGNESKEHLLTEIARNASERGPERKEGRKERDTKHDF